MKKKTVSFVTIGCRVNQYETAVLRNLFLYRGFQIVDAGQAADIAVINTCTVTDQSDTDTRRWVHRLRRLNPQVRIAAVGCQAQLQADSLAAMPNVFWVIGNEIKLNLADIIAQDDAPQIAIRQSKRPSAFRIDMPGSDPTRTRANLKIQDGCNNFCSYCEVPYARGRARSRDFKNILTEARALVKAGHQEIILTGINVGAYQHQGRTLLDVIEAMEDLQRLERIRISSIEPTRILEKVIAHMAVSQKLCRHLHIPVQYGADEILTRMGRHYTVRDLERLFAQAAAQVPGICVGTDVIVGFPGETLDTFEQTYQFLKSQPIHYFHVFRFSVRPNAVAGRLDDQVPAEELRRRSERLRALGLRKRNRFYRGLLGQTVAVLFEQRKNDFWQGLTDHFVPVRVSSEKNLKNKIRRVELNSIHGSLITGLLIL